MTKTTKIIVVDKKDRKIGLEDKLKCHLGKGILHRAFVVFVFNKENKLLIQQRSKFKFLWPLFWDGSCASHVLGGETYLQAGRRRLKEEFGFTCPLKSVDKFQYQIQYKNIGSENEICAVLIGKYNGKVKPNPKEIADWKRLGPNELKKDIKKRPGKYTPWLKLGLKSKFFKQGCLKKGVFKVEG